MMRALIIILVLSSLQVFAAGTIKDLDCSAAELSPADKEFCTLASAQLGEGRENQNITICETDQSSRSFVGFGFDSDGKRVLINGSGSIR